MGYKNYAYKVGNRNLHNTGTDESDKVCNIYDMAQNMFEWTTEYSNNILSGDTYYNVYPCVCRTAGSRKP